MKTEDWIRLLFTAVLIIEIFNHAHWSVGIFVVLVTIEIEIRNYTARLARERKQKEHNEWLRRHGMGDLADKP